MQETKLADSAAPVAEFRAAGYELAHHGDGRWNRVAIASSVGIAVVTNFGGGSGPHRRPRSRLWVAQRRFRLRDISTSTETWRSLPTIQASP